MERRKRCTHGFAKGRFVCGRPVNVPLNVKLSIFGKKIRPLITVGFR